MQNERKGGWIETWSGKRFWPIDPRSEDVDINDIAHALSMQCRFLGHIPFMYTVAQHSVYVLQTFRSISEKIWCKEACLAVLMHDGAEAYVCDCSSPIKPYLTNYQEIEDRILESIYEKFDITEYLMPQCTNDTLYRGEKLQKLLHKADMMMLAAEALYFGMNKKNDWTLPEPPANININPWTPHEAKVNFLKAFEELTKDEEKVPISKV